MTLPMYMLAMTAPEEVGCSWSSRGPRADSRGSSGAPSSMAMTALAGMPRVSRGMKAPPVAALLADSGPATPSMAPVPNFSGCLETLFSTA